MEQLKMVENAWEWMEWMDIAVNGCTWLEMAANGWQRLELLEIARNC